MSQVDWQSLLGWTDEDLADLRFVGYAYIKQGHYKIALKFFSSLVILSPDSLYDLQIVGALHLQLGDNMAALNYLDRALSIDPTHGPTLLNRTKALLLLGYHKQGLAQAALLKTNQDPKVANQAEALLLSYS